MAHVVAVDARRRLDDYAAVGPLAPAVADLRAEAERLTPLLRGRTVWMVNSTAQGGGVAELLPPLVALLRDLGVAVEWSVMETERAEFFALTKRLHNMIHGAGDAGGLARADRALYDAVSEESARSLLGLVGPQDIVVVHDPQPLGAGALLARELGVRAIWRCHIGLDEPSAAASAAWEFLMPYALAYGDAVFSAREYVPELLAGRASVIYPGIDPLSHKNRELSLHKLVGVLCDAALAVPHWPLLAPPFPAVAQRLQSDGSFAPATDPEDMGLLARPIVTQVSRWDRLKGFGPLLEAFRLLKRGRAAGAARDERHRRRLDLVRLVLAGPDPAAIQDDPEALEVLDDLRARYGALAPEVRRDVAVITLPMVSLKENALMVNALQRASTVIAQNSLREGFGLTVAEAMWKAVPVLGSARACGVRQQVRHGLDGCLVPDPEDGEAIAEAMRCMLADADELERWGRNAQHRVHEEFLVFRQIRSWLRLLASDGAMPPRSGSGGAPLSPRDAPYGTDTVTRSSSG